MVDQHSPRKHMRSVNSPAHISTTWMITLTHLALPHRKAVGIAELVSR